VPSHPKRPSVGDYMKGDDSQDASGQQRRCADHERRQLRSHSGEHQPRRLCERRIVAPAERRSSTDQDGRAGERNEADVEAEDGTSAEPVDHAKGGVGGLVLRGLDVPDEEGGHEERRWRNEEELRGGNGAIDRVHIYFVLQSETWVNR
jgi:hypothetical protein